MLLEKELKKKLAARARERYFGSSENIILTPGQFIEFFDKLNIFPKGVSLIFQDNDNFICSYHDRVISKIPWGKNRICIKDFVQLGFLLLMETWDQVLARDNRSKQDPLGSMLEDRNRILQELIQAL